VGPACRRYRSIAASGDGAVQRPAVSSKCEQCDVVSCRRKLKTDVFLVYLESLKEVVLVLLVDFFHIHLITLAASTTEVVEQRSGVSLFVCMSRLFLTLMRL